MRILITGGAGYIGSVLSETLLDANHQVTAVDNLLFPQPSLLGLVHRPGFEFVRGDARDSRLMAELVPKADVLIPLAAIVGAPACDLQPRDAREINLEAIEQLLTLRSPQQMFLFPNTNSGYGSRPGETCTEDSPFAPVSLYGRTKVAAEQKILEAGGAVTFRLATAFGASPRLRLDLLVNDFTHQAITTGTLVLYESSFRRNFIHVRDIAGAFLFALENFDALRDQTYNVGLSDANLTKLQLAERIRLQVPRLTIIEEEFGQDPDKRDYLVSNEKIESAGWRPRYSLDDGIREIITACSMLPTQPFRNV
ncbi:MAG: NAD(P)-dependent oxidoreductase [Deltaproteobacteria bacterium]|nr:NAD(P)-dependent oxidoreductase [Deltaproteobacteria bacterium]